MKLSLPLDEGRIRIILEAIGFGKDDDVLYNESTDGDMFKAVKFYGGSIVSASVPKAAGPWSAARMKISIVDYCETGLLEVEKSISAKMEKFNATDPQYIMSMVPEMNALFIYLNRKEVKEMYTVRLNCVASVDINVMATDEDDAVAAALREVKRQQLEYSYSDYSVDCVHKAES